MVILDNCHNSLGTSQCFRDSGLGKLWCFHFPFVFLDEACIDSGSEVRWL